MRIMLIAAVMAVAAGCATYKTSYRNPGVSKGGAVHEADQSFLMWGMIGGEPVDLATLCPEGVAEVRSQQSGLDNVLFWLTGGLYAPMTVEVECAGGTAHSGVMSREAVVAVQREVSR